MSLGLLSVAARAIDSVCTETGVRAHYVDAFEVRPVSIDGKPLLFADVTDVLLGGWLTGGAS